jgi:predicted signal transduction protein with EAL and GGDEF domain
MAPWPCPPPPRPPRTAPAASRSRAGGRRVLDGLDLDLPARAGVGLIGVDGWGSAYRMGGDEFCLLAHVGRDDAERLVARAAAALSERGERFAVGCSYGMVPLAGASIDPSEALRIADQRMYANKRGGRRSSEEAIHRCS